MVALCDGPGVLQIEFLQKEHHNQNYLTYNTMCSDPASHFAIFTLVCISNVHVMYSDPTSRLQNN